MNYKILLFTSLILMISFSTGIFVEIASGNNVSISPELPSFWISFWGAVKSDLFMVLLSIFFTYTVYFLPCIGVFILCKTFSLGFSAAYLCMLPEQGHDILFAVLLPRTILKLPAYVALFMVSYKAAKQIKTARSRQYSYKNNLLEMIKAYLFCLILLAGSSLIEVLLVQAVL